MGRVADPKLAALWRKRVERQPGSGLSVLDYCRREGISTASFYAWKRRLHTPGATVGRRSRKGVRPQEPNGQPLPSGFVQVPLSVNSVIEVCFGDGTTVRVPAEHLSATLKLLKASPARRSNR
jgi:hypothetical protein